MKRAIIIALLSLGGCVSPQDYLGCAQACGTHGVKKLSWNGQCECNPPPVSGK